MSKTEFQQIIEGQLDLVYDPLSDNELAEAARRCNFAYGPETKLLREKYYDLAAQKGLTPEEARHAAKVFNSGRWIFKRVIHGKK